MVGRQIVDRAKIQRIIFEFDYYEKAFHQFYDTYRVVPGNLDEKTCNKYTEFKTKLVCSFGNAYSHVVKNAPGKVIQTLLNWRSVAYPMTHLRAAKLIEGGSLPREIIRIDLNDMSVTKWFSNLMYFNVVQRDFSQASFDRNVFYNFFGFNFKGNAWEDTMYYFPGCTTMYGDKNELSNTNFKNILRSKNVIAMLNVADFLKEGNGVITDNADVGTNDGSNGNRTNGCNKNAQGSMSAKLTAELDAKIDDGRPGSGKLLALKAFQATKSSATENDILSTCYDGKFEDITSAIYNSSKNRKFGCNVMYVLEDLK